MANKIHTNHSLAEYNKKYGKLGLKKVNIGEADKDPKVLNGHSWWLIKDTYYEIPTNKGFKSWWSNLGKGGQIALCALLGAGVATAVVVPTVIALNNKSVNHEAVIDVDSSGVSITSQKYNNGNLEVLISYDSENKEIESLELYMGNEKLKIEVDYTFDGDKKIVINKETLNNNKTKEIVIKPVLQNKSPITPVVNKLDINTSSVKNQNVGDKLNLDGIAIEASYSDGKKETVNKSDVIFSPSEGTTLTSSGTNKIRATYKGFIKEFEIQVGEKVIHVTGVKVIGSTSIEVGGKDQLIATVSPSDATNKNVSWESDNPSVATVDAKSGLVTAVAEGKANITVTTEDGGKTATCLVTVNSAVIPVSSVSCKSDLIINEQETVGFDRLGVTISPAEASQEYTVQVNNSGSDIVEVNNTNKTIKSKKAGTASLRVISNDDESKYHDCEVTVKETVKEISKDDFTKLLETSIKTQESLSGGGIAGEGAFYNKDQITMSMTIAGEERDVTGEIESVNNTTVFFNEEFAQQIGTNSFDLSAEAHKDQILEAAQSGGSTFTQNTDTGAIAVAGGSGGATTAEVSSFGYLCCLAVPSQCDVRIDYNGAPAGQIPMNMYKQLFQQYCFNYFESTSKYKLEQINNVTIGGEVIPQENLTSLRYTVRAGISETIDCVLTAITEQAKGEEEHELNANYYIDQLSGLNENGIFTLEGDGTITYEYASAEYPNFKKLNVNAHGYVVACDNFSLTFNSDPVDTIKTITKDNFIDSLDAYQGAFDENENEYDCEDMLFLWNNEQTSIDNVSYGTSTGGERFCEVSFIDGAWGEKKRFKN